MSIAEHGKTPLERAADQALDGRLFLKAVRWSQLNPEQQLAYMMEELIVIGKAKLAMMQMILPIGQACVEWRKTEEGQAWTAKQAAKRAAQEERKQLVQQIDLRLLASLKEAHRLLDSYTQGDHTGRPWLREMEDVIAKAEAAKGNT